MMTELAENAPGVLLRAISSFWLNLFYLGGKAVFTCIVDHDGKDSRLSWLDIVLVCLDGV